MGFVLALAGFFVLSLGMKRHYSPLWSVLLQINNTRSFVNIIILRMLGGLLLLSASLPFTSSQGVAVGLVYWTATLTFAALLQAFLFTYWKT